MSKFKPGDRVKRIAGLNSVNKNMIIGSIYTVKELDIYIYDDIFLQEAMGEWDIDNFKLVQEAPAFYEIYYF
jgi:hypothetical protein